MAIADIERRRLGAPVTTPVRAVAGVLAAVGLAGHAALAAAAVAYLGAVLTAAL